jgi:hypothetical protein
MLGVGFIGLAPHQLGYPLRSLYPLPLTLLHPLQLFPFPAPVKRIIPDSETAILQMNSDLMRPARDRLDEK